MIDPLKQKVGENTLGFPLGGAGAEWVPAVMGDRGSVEAEVGKKLETVEKNPAPERRGGKAAENRRARRERRYGRRRESSVWRGEGGGLTEGGGSLMGRAMMMMMTVVTWNLQRVLLREQNRGRLRRDG